MPRMDKTGRSDEVGRGGRLKNSRGRLRLGEGMIVERWCRSGIRWILGSKVSSGVRWYSAIRSRSRANGTGTVRRTICGRPIKSSMAMSD